MQIDEQPKKKVKFQETETERERERENELEFELEKKNSKRKKSFKLDVYLSDDSEVEDSDKESENDDQHEDQHHHADDHAADADDQHVFSDKDNDNDNDIDSFNLDQELDEGEFTQSGLYIRKKDEMEIHDSWLKGIGKKEILKAQEQAQARAHAASLKKDTDLHGDNPSSEMCFLELFRLLQPPSESVVAAIKRLGAVASRTPKWKKVKQKPGKPLPTPMPMPMPSDEEMAANKLKLDRLTTLATTLFDTNPSIYEMTYKDIAMHLSALHLI